jgi:hypothetical protein
LPGEWKKYVSVKREYHGKEGEFGNPCMYILFAKE